IKKALHLLSVLAADLVQLTSSNIKARGKGIVSRWLIHLANRPEQTLVDSQKKFLWWTALKGGILPPVWLPVIPWNPPASWWAVRLTNVFQLSRVAIDPGIDRTSRSDTTSLSAALNPVMAHTAPWDGDDWDALEPRVRRLLLYMSNREKAD